MPLAGTYVDPTTKDRCRILDRLSAVDIDSVEMPRMDDISTLARTSRFTGECARCYRSFTSHRATHTLKEAWKLKDHKERELLLPLKKLSSTLEKETPEKVTALINLLDMERSLAARLVSVFYQALEKWRLGHPLTQQKRTCAATHIGSLELVLPRTSLSSASNDFAC